MRSLWRILNTPLFILWRRLKGERDFLDGKLYDLARKMIREIDKKCTEGTSGEYKRRVVYAQILKTMPEAKKRDVGLAIEVAVRSEL